MDELGRGTSVKDGLSIAFAVSEKLIKMKSRVFFATHFTSLARLLNAQSYQRDVLNVHFREEQNEILLPVVKVPHTLAGGPVQNEDWGIKLARIVLPLPAVYKAEEVERVLKEMNQRPPQSGEKAREARQNKIVLALPDVLTEALNSSMDDAALASYLQRLQTELTLSLSEVTDVIHDLIEGGRKRPAEDDAEAESGAGEGREKRRREE
ncbi:MutS protein msh4 [Neurospora sp. IMI 360204]|nr:MutS protein msh4 [Neurospora sp. IMI 360204]